MKKEHVPITGTYALTSDTRGKLTWEKLIRNTMRANGYPCTSCDDGCGVDGVAVPNPDLCALLTELGCMTGGGGSNPLTVLDTTSVNLTLASDVLSAAVILAPSNNLLVASGTGLQLTCEAIQDCIGATLTGGNGLDYNDTTNTFNIKLSADAGNCLSFGTDAGVFYNCAGGVNTLNGISGDGSTGNEVVLGGSLDRNTLINATTTHSFTVTKDNVKLELVNAALPGGSGESVRFYGTDATTVAEMGVYTPSIGGSPTAGVRTGTSLVYYNARFLPQTDTLICEAGFVADEHKFVMALGTSRAQFGMYSGSLQVGMEIEDTTLGNGNSIILLKGLPTYATNAAAVTGLLPVDALYKTATGELRIRV